MAFLQDTMDSWHGLMPSLEVATVAGQTTYPTHVLALASQSSIQYDFVIQVSNVSNQFLYGLK